MEKSRLDSAATHDLKVSYELGSLFTAEVDLLKLG
jgi:hypothetical protein